VFWYSTFYYRTSIPVGIRLKEKRALIIRECLQSPDVLSVLAYMAANSNDFTDVTIIIILHLWKMNEHTSMRNMATMHPITM
jgi:hypothetical protein